MISIFDKVKSIFVSSLEKLYSKKEYDLILHNDNSVDGFMVISNIIDIVGLERTESTNIVMDAHTIGRSLIGTFDEKTAFEYKKQLDEKGITTTLE